MNIVEQIKAIKIPRFGIQADLESAFHKGIDSAIDVAEEAEDYIDGLKSELENAVQVAYNFGAHDWCKSNFPSQFEEMEKFAQPEGCSVASSN